MQISREFIHGKKFDEQWKVLGLNDEHLKELQSTLLDNPKAGTVIQGTGRLRKMRFSYGNRGKSHCARVCYVDFEIHGRIVLIILKSRRKLNLRFQNLVFTRVHGISSTILELRRVSFITLPKNAVNP